jgi:hypothetical protein
MGARILKNVTLMLITAIFLTACELMQVKEPTSKSITAKVPEQPAVIPGSFQIETDISESEELLTLLRYSRMILEISGEQLVNEFKKINNDYNNGPTIQGRLKLAMLLSRESTRFKDNNRAIKVLGEVINGYDDEYDAVLQEYAHLFISSLKKQSKSDKKLSQINERLGAERKLRKQLEKQLEALKTIEKTISSRHNESEGP